jgi:hypothetical protein
MTIYPKKSFAYNVRFASGLALLVLLCVFDWSATTELIKQSPVTAAAMVPIAWLLGLGIYYFYRANFYYPLMAVSDALGTENYRNYIRQEFAIDGNWLQSTITADRLFVAVGKKSIVTEREEYNFSATHLFYQSAILAFLLSIAALCLSLFGKAAILCVIGFAFALTAHQLNNQVEHEDLLFLRSKQRELQKTASHMGFVKRVRNKQ